MGAVGRRASSLAIVLVFAALGRPARAEVTLPDGQVVPKDSGSEVQVYTLFSDRGEAIDWLADAHDVPDTFSPLCDFTATLVLKQSGSSLGVGWYNVVPGATAPPLATEIYEVVPAGSTVGTMVTGASIRQDSRYLGGLIGFALIRLPAHFTETRWNTVCSFCASPGPWILGVKYQSTVEPNAFYIAFEDGDTTAFGWSNDGDYNDYVFYFTGIACAGAGEPCEVDGQAGICLEGLTECDSEGALYCKQLVEPEAEACNGIDDDCDGDADDGDDLCDAGLVCVRGSCVPHCGEEFPCLGGDVCEQDLCVHPDCVGVTCESGQACIEGECRAPCDGVVCPGERVCRSGACVDPCLGVTCPDGQVCAAGVCLLDCNCQSCPAALACDAESGRCTVPACVGVACDAASVCRDGACEDACAAASCPAGQACTEGECVEDGSTDEPSTGTPTPPGTTPGHSLGDTDGGVATEGSGSTATSDPMVPRRRNGKESGCRAGSSDASLALAGVLVGLVAWVRCRRRLRRR